MSGNHHSGSAVLVRCMDPRLTESDEFNAWAKKEFGPKHDLISTAGGPIRLMSPSSDAYVDLGISLHHHHVSRIGLCLHSDCGYNNEFHPEEVSTPEREHAWKNYCFHRAAVTIRQRFASATRHVAIEYYYATIHPDGSVTVDRVPAMTVEEHLSTNNIQPNIKGIEPDAKRVQTA